MSAVPFENIDYDVRTDIVNAHSDAWKRIAAPGTWLNSERRLAVVAEIRQVQNCNYCKRIKTAVSPFGLEGNHQTTKLLGDPEVELIHRGISDSGRLSQAWARKVIESGLTEGEYVEIVGIIASVMILDTMTMALGSKNTELPNKVSGEPRNYLPPGAKVQAAWLPIVEPEDAVETDEPLYPSPKAAYIYRGLSMVPESLRNYWAIANTHYIPGQYVYQFDQSIRAISRPQMELIAARVSGLHECAY